MLRGPLLIAYERLYGAVALPQLFKMSAQTAHEWVLRCLMEADKHPAMIALAAGIRRATLPIIQPTEVGGVSLRYPLILAAGFVKGVGFRSQTEALQAVRAGQNIMPGWRSMPNLVGLVEYGSFTRQPRIGNPGTVIWRHTEDRSTQNRVGLKNPGVVAAAEFMGRHLDRMPPQFGINIAISPGMDDPEREVADVEASAAAFLSRGVRPTWFTLNVSCPNTEDDPSGHQTHDKTERLVQALVGVVAPTPVWIKISPGLGSAQYDALLQATENVGGQAIIATNTIAMPTPDQDGLVAGIGGGRLYSHALEAVSALMNAKRARGSKIDIVACGGILDGGHWHAYHQLGVKAMQYWSAMVYRGPLAAALILHDIQKDSA